MSAFVLQIQDLDEAGKDWRFSIGAEWLDRALADTDLRPGTTRGALEVHAQRNGEDVLVRGRGTASLVASCARCLEDVSIDVDLALTALFSPEHRRPAGAGEVEVRPDEVTRDYFGGNEIVLDAMLREHFLLEAPMKPLCSEECKGIAIPDHVRPPEHIFADSAPDARFAPLMKLKQELEQQHGLTDEEKEE